MFDVHNYNVHNLYPAEAWEVCEMFMIAAFKVMGVTLQFTESIDSVHHLYWRMTDNVA